MQTQSATYQQLQSILATTYGCPVCHLGLKAGHRYLDALLWESVNDPGVRRTLTNSLGLCGRHSRELLAFPGERLGVAIVQRAVLQEAMHQLQDRPASGENGLLQRLQNGFLSRSRPAVPGEDDANIMPCPACTHQNEVEENALRELTTNLAGDLERPLQQAGGLCLPHLQRAVRICEDSQTADALLQLHRQLWLELLENLSQFIRKNDHRFRNEPVSELERAAIDRSIAVLTGEYPIR